MSAGEEIDHLDFAAELEESVESSIWHEHVLHFTPGDNAVFTHDEHLSDEELYQLAIAYDIAMAEDGENMTWEEYLREQARDH